MVDYVAIHALAPCSVAVFSCECGASSLEFDVKREAPDDWLARDDGSHLCPHCADKTSTTTA